MEDIRRFETINEYNVFNNVETLHPLVSVVDFSKADPICQFIRKFGFYTVFLKDVMCGDMQYGKHSYDYQEGTLVFIAPGQTYGIYNADTYIQPAGFALVFVANVYMSLFALIRTDLKKARLEAENEEEKKLQ